MSTPLLYCPTCGAANAAGEDLCFACGKSLARAVDEQLDEFLLQGRYQILGQAGTGGFGAVYRARDTLQGNQVVAVKQINLRGLTPQETIEATDGFNREVQLLSTLAHEHLPHIHDHFTDAEHWYLVMDFIAGETLERYLTDETVSQHAIRMLSFDEILDIGLQLCAVLHYLHTRQPVIIFRDLKPSNIMRTPQGKLYLIDFGIARRFTPGKPKDTIPLGSPGYAAPEQYGKAQTTPRADIYSLGVLLHHLLSGTDPAETPFTFPSLRLYGSSGLAELETLILHMVALDASQRPGSIAEVREELQHVVALRSQVEPHAWHAPGVPGTTIKGQNGLIHYWQTTNFASQRSQGPHVMPGMQAQHTHIAQYTQYTQQGIHLLQPAPSSRRKLLVNGLAVGVGLLIGGVPLLSSLHLRRIQDTPPFATSELERVVHKYSVPINAMAWSPDGNYLALTTGHSTLSVWNTRNWLVHSFDSIGPVHSLSWSPDSSMLANTAGTALQIWSVGRREILYQLDNAVNSMRNAVQWSPREPTLALAGSDGAVNILDVSDLQHVKIVDTYRNVPARQNKVLLAWSPDGMLIATNVSEMVQVRTAVNGEVASMVGQPRNNPIIMSWSPDSSSIATANGDRFAQLWDQRDGTLLASYDTADEGSLSITDLTWSPDGHILGAATMSGKLYFWYLQQKQLQTFTSYNTLEPAPASLIAWSPRDQRIAVGYDDGRCLVWRAPTA
ncbi:MAG: hypothetical protein PVS3B1_18390 [Ktedonobacteraceae bacterium]